MYFPHNLVLSSFQLFQPLFHPSPPFHARADRDLLPLVFLLHCFTGQALDGQDSSHHPHSLCPTSGHVVTWTVCILLQGLLQHQVHTTYLWRRGCSGCKHFLLRSLVTGWMKVMGWLLLGLRCCCVRRKGRSIATSTTSSRVCLAGSSRL